MTELEHAADLPTHQLQMALVVMEHAHSELVATLHELARRHGVRAAARLLGVSPMTVSRWRHGDTPGRDALRSARTAAHHAVSPADTQL